MVLVSVPSWMQELVPVTELILIESPQNLRLVEEVLMEHPWQQQPVTHCIEDANMMDSLHYLDHPNIYEDMAF